MGRATCARELGACDAYACASVGAYNRVYARVHAYVCTIAISSSSFITPHRLQNRVVAYELSRHIDYIMTKGNHCKQQAMGQSPSVGCYARTHARVRARAHTRTQTRTHSCTHEHACMQHHMAHKSQERTALMALTLCCCFKLSSQEVSWCRGRIPRACLYTGLCTHA